MSKYRNLSLALLKTELRKRKVRLSGRKQELIHGKHSSSRVSNTTACIGVARIFDWGGPVNFRH